MTASCKFALVWSDYFLGKALSHTYIMCVLSSRWMDGWLAGWMEEMDKKTDESRQEDRTGQDRTNNRQVDSESRILASGPLKKKPNLG